MQCATCKARERYQRQHHNKISDIKIFSIMDEYVSISICKAIIVVCTLLEVFDLVLINYVAIT